MTIGNEAVMALAWMDSDDEARQHIAEVRQARGLTEDYVVESGTVAKKDVSRSLEQIVQRARRGEHIQVTSYGRRDVVIISDVEYDDLMRDQEELRKIQGK